MRRYAAGTVSLLIVLALALALSASAQDDAEYVGNSEKKCALCHQEQVAAWKDWPMARTWQRLSAAQKKDKNCLPCHTTGYGKPGGFVSEAKTPGLTGVHCESCHGPASKHLEIPITDRAGRKESMLVPTEAGCKTCHKKEGNPNFKPFRYKDSVKKLADHLKS
jgi:hypothetical protein